MELVCITLPRPAPVGSLTTSVTVSESLCSVQLALPFSKSPLTIRLSAAYTSADKGSTVHSINAANSTAKILRNCFMVVFLLFIGLSLYKR